MSTHAKQPYNRYYETFDFSDCKRFPEEDVILQLNEDIFQLTAKVLALHDKVTLFQENPATSWKDYYGLSLMLLRARSIENHYVHNFNALEHYWSCYKSRVHPGRRESFAKFYENSTSLPVALEKVAGLTRVQFTAVQNMASYIERMLPSESSELPETRQNNAVQQQIMETFAVVQEKINSLEETALFLQRQNVADIQRLELRITKMEKELSQFQKTVQADTVVDGISAIEFVPFQDHNIEYNEPKMETFTEIMGKERKRNCSNLKEEPTFKIKRLLPSILEEKRIVHKMRSGCTYSENILGAPKATEHGIHKSTVLFIPMNEKVDGKAKDGFSSDSFRLIATGA